MPDHPVTLHAIRNDYARYEGVYDQKWASFNKTVHDWVLERLPKTETAHMLDLGCGTGSLIAKASERRPAWNFTGIDGSPEMLDQARKAYSHGDYQILNLDELELPLHTYDVITSLNVLHHLNSPYEFLRTMATASRKDGSVFISDFALASLPMKMMDSYWRIMHPAYNRAYSPDDMAGFFDHAGLKIMDQDILKPNAFWRLQVYQLRT